MHMSAGAFGGEPKKVPEMITFYNGTKGGVDCADQTIQTYSSKFSTRRWPVVVFCNIPVSYTHLTLPTIYSV